MTKTASHVTPLVESLFEEAAAALRERGESAYADVSSVPNGATSVALEVDREGGDWQRNLIVVVEASAAGWAVEAKIVNEHSRVVAAIGHVEVTDSALAEVALALVRAGIARLNLELKATVAA